MIKKKLSKLSYDKSNKIIVCNYSNEFIDLDDTKGILNKSQSPNSPDMLYIDDNRKEIWFVEFKSSNKKRLEAYKEKIKLRKKIFSGLFLIYEIDCDKACDYKNYEKFYFIVYNKEKIESFEDEFLSLSNDETDRSIEFGLGDLKPQFVKDIFTEDCDKLRKLFKDRFDIDFTKETK